MNNVALTGEQEQFLKEGAVKVETQHGVYYLVPYWYKQTRFSGCFEEYSFDEIPSDLKDELNKVRNV